MKEFLIAVLSAVLSSAFTILLQLLFKNIKSQKDILFDVYMKLIELNEYYFWLSSFEINNEPEPEEIKMKAKNLKWTIADMSRKLKSKELSDILKVLFLENINHQERHSRLSLIIDNIGYKANSKYKKIMSEISSENINLWQSKYKN